MEDPGPTTDGSTPTPYQRGHLARGWVEIDWMICGNPECGELVIRMHETRPTGLWLEGEEGRTRDTTTESWWIRPRFGSRPLPKEVEEPFRTDYAEAAALLDVSPRMAAVLARRIVGDLLKKYANAKHWSLAARIRSFVAESGHPSGLTSNLEHLREIADFGAHTQEVELEREDGELEVLIIDADRVDAEWTLDLIDRMFDYFIVQPARDEAMKSKWDDHISKTGRKPLRENDAE
jgi:hypothetical protein